VADEVGTMADTIINSHAGRSQMDEESIAQGIYTLPIDSWSFAHPLLCYRRQIHNTDNAHGVTHTQVGYKT
jgi:hypothetical protein